MHLYQVFLAVTTDTVAHVINCAKCSDTAGHYAPW